MGLDFNVQTQGLGKRGKVANKAKPNYFHILIYLPTRDM